MKEKLLFKPIVILFTTIFVFMACEKEEILSEINEQKNNSVINTENTLIFPSVQTAMDISQKLSLMNENELIAWYKENEFVSLKTKIDEAIEEISKSESEEQFQINLLKHKKYIETNEKDEIVPIFKYHLYTLIANPDGYFVVNGALHKIYEKKIVVALDGQIETIEKFMFSHEKEKSKNIKVIDLIAYTKNLHEFDWGYSFSVEELGLDNNKRKLRLDVNNYRLAFSDIYGNTLYQCWVDVKCTGYTKNIWGNWVGYKTPYDLGYVKLFTSGADLQDNGEWWYKAEIKYPVEVETGDLYYKTWSYSFGDMVQDNSLTAQGLIYSEINATSRGIGAKWITIKIND